MTALDPFSNGEFRLYIELHDEDGLRVKAPGLARALGFREAYDLLRGIPESEKGSEIVRTPGGDQRVGYVTEAGFYRALGQRQTARITDDAVRASVERFQAWVYHEVLPSIRKNGGYISASATADQLDILARQAAVLTALRPIADAGWLDAKARILGARALGETPELDQATKPLTVSIYLQRKGLKGKEQKAAASMFGKRLKALYVEAYGEEPPSIEDVVGRHVVKVAQYQEQHVRLFDQVWTKYYGGAA